MGNGSDFEDRPGETDKNFSFGKIISTDMFF